MEPGILFTERQFGLLELHSSNRDDLAEAGKAILRGIGAKAEDQLAPVTLFQEIIEDISDQHAIILNRSRDASMLLPGTSLLVYEMAPALFACVAANEAERAAPDVTLNDVQMMGASGRIFMSGTVSDLEKGERCHFQDAGGREGAKGPEARRIVNPCVSHPEVAQALGSDAIRVSFRRSARSQRFPVTALCPQ